MRDRGRCSCIAGFKGIPRYCKSLTRRRKGDGLRGRLYHCVLEKRWNFRENVDCIEREIYLFNKEELICIRPFSSISIR